MIQSRPEKTKNISGNTSNNLSLQTRLVLFVLLVALIPLIIITTRDTLQTQQALTNGAEVSLESSAAQTANSVDTFIQTTLDSVGIEAQLNDFVTYLTLPPSQRSGTQTETTALGLLNKLRRKGELFHDDFYYIKSYALVDVNGTVLLDTVSTNIQKNESKETYFSQTQNATRPIVSAVTYSDDNTTSITFASRIMSVDGNYLGIMRVKYYSDIFQNVIAKSVGTATDASVLLLDPLHIRMADNQHPELVLKSIVPLGASDYSLAVDSHLFLNAPAEQQATNYPDFEAALKNASKQPFFRAETTPDTPGDDTIAVAFLKTLPWTITYSRPTSILLADVQGQTRTNIILVFIALIIISLITALIARSLTNPIKALSIVANSITQGDLDARAKVNSTDEIGVLASAFNSMTNQLQSTLAGLEQRIAERTKDLQRSTLELETIATVTHEISIIHDVDTLLKVSVELIHERFQYYHVGIFLIDERGEFAILRAASGAVAPKMLEQNYRLIVGQEGLVGNVTKTGQAHIALDIDMDTAHFQNPFLAVMYPFSTVTPTSTDTTHFQNPFLPQTRSAIALPLRNRNITIGALDIQTEVPSAFNEQNIKVLQLLADQLAAAIENAQLSQKIEGSLAEITNVNRLQTQQMWQAAVNQREKTSYEYDGLQIRAVPNHLPDNLLKQLESGKPIVVNEDHENKNRHAKTTLLVPLMVLDQVIGVVGLEKEDPDHKWTEQEVAIAQAAANRAGLTLENARLIEESQRRAIKERTIFESTARIGSALNIENILQATVEELERVLSDSEVILQFQSDNDQKPGK